MRRKLRSRCISRRHAFISDLARAGVHPRNAQALAHHSRINLTMHVSSHALITDEAGEIRKLPCVPVAAGQTETKFA